VPPTVNRPARSSCAGSRAVDGVLQRCRVARVTPLVELTQWGRMAATLTMLSVQVFLTACLWRALYASTDVSAGLDARQAVTFAVLAALHGRVRWSERRFNRDAILPHVREGTILYWFLRPMPPRRYYLVRAIGDLGYGACWALAGYLVCLAAGVVAPPRSAAAGLVTVASLLLGQVILYYLTLTVDLLCFWTVVNHSAVRIYQFAQSLLSGALAPLWYFPAWFVTASAWLPFQGTLNVPLSLYVGRLPVSTAGHETAVQACWVLVLAGLTRLLWWRAGRRVAVQGG
jgi:ABC-2 type transport system permease protein